MAQSSSSYPSAVITHRHASCNNTTQTGGYLHIGDSKTISRTAATIDYDKRLANFTLRVTGKSSVLVNGKPYTQSDKPVPLSNGYAVRIGASLAQGMSRFYFLLPLDKPNGKLNELFLRIAMELDRAGMRKLSGRDIANAVRDKWPYYGAEAEFTSLPRRAVAYMTKSKKLFEKNGQQGRTNLFRYIGEGASSGAGSSSSSSSGGGGSGGGGGGDSESKTTATKTTSKKRERSASQAEEAEKEPEEVAAAAAAVAAAAADKPVARKKHKAS